MITPDRLEQEEPKEFECNVCGCEIDKPGICTSNSCFQANIL